MAEGEVIKVPLDELEPAPVQPRTECSQESLLELAKTMEESGQVQPLIGYRKNGKVYHLSGNRRCQAAKLSGKIRTLDVLLVKEPPSLAAALEQVVLANLHEPLSPMDEARTFDAYVRETGLSGVKAAQRLGTSASAITKARALLKLTPAIQERVEKGEISKDAAYQISQAADPVDQEQLAALVKDRGFSRDAIAGKVKSRKRAAPIAEGAAPARVTACLDGGRSVTVSGPGLASLDQLVQWIEELLAKARKARPRGTGLSTFLALLRDESRAASKATTTGEAPSNGAAS